MFETPARIEPCLFDEAMPLRLADLAVEIRGEASRIGQGLHPDTAAGLCVSPTPKAPVRLAFPPVWRERLFPNLFATAPQTGA